MADDDKPSLADRRTKATFDLFKELGCLRDGGGDDGELTINDVGRLDVEKMMARALDCVAAVCEAQRVRVELEQPITLREDGDALTSEEQAARNKVFRAALKAVATGLTHDGGELGRQSWPRQQLLRAFPDSGKLADGRSWLPMHWAVVVDEENEFDVSEVHVMSLYESDPMALRKHHLVAVTDPEADDEHFGYTPPHLLCGLEMSERNMSLVRRLSVFDSRAFTMKVVDKASAEHSFSALHVACYNSDNCTEALLRLLVQLDPSQMKSITRRGGPLGLLCQYSEKPDERQLTCLIEADSSVEVVYDAITSCFVSNDRVRTVAKLLTVNPAVAQHRDNTFNLAHTACVHSHEMVAGECVEILKLLLTHHKDVLKEADDSGRLPAYVAAVSSPVKVLTFLLGEYPEAAAVVDTKSRNLLHNLVRYANFGPEEHRTAKVRLLCARYPGMMLQRDSNGHTPLFLSCRRGLWALFRLLLLEGGGREAASTAVLHPTNERYKFNGALPLDYLIDRESATLKAKPLSEAADAFRLLLRLYPEAAGIEGGIGARKKTPYCLAVMKDLPTYYRRLLLRAAPDLDPAELRRLNWAERRLAMFMAYAAVVKQAKTPLLLARLRAENKDLVKHVVSFL